MYPTHVALACLVRSTCINAAMTARGMQQIGMAFVLSPALRYLYPEPAAQNATFARYSGPTNTHPFMLPLFAGIVLSLEEAVAEGSLPVASVNAIRETLATSLSALGDAFFSGTLLPLWALTCINLLLCGYMSLALLCTAILFLAQLLFRAYTFFYGLRLGMTALVHLRQLNGINWAGRLKLINAALTVLLIWQLPPSHIHPFPWSHAALDVLAMLAAAWLVDRMHLPRIVLWAMVLCVILMDLDIIGM
ncbi:MAG: PTS system mannose/fructose/sorbose family transporter subunit IID [Desulfovibrio sp.]|nr:PTS system mannose/fructose/sorbose family transporter subunit IID [Desulfovibrio sp.]